MTLQEAKNLKQGQYVYHKTKKNANGAPMRAVVLSIKTWKTRPNEIIVSVKRGLRDFAKFNQDEIHILTTNEAQK